ncbi:MAG: DUF262 domain-containing protein [Lachnospiraceae bacterium]|nr:DUF262 domain-containing protein [Lachnospiraceae bacterium]
MEIQKSEFEEYLKLSSKVESEYNGIEVDDENESMETEEPYEVENIRVDQKMITIFQIEHWITQNNLDLSPEYQRNIVWDDERKSSLIESLLLRIPIPAFYLDENKQGIKSVIDGMQRLSAIHSFLNNEFCLKKMQYLSHLEKKRFRDLETKFRGRIEDTELAVNILDEKCPQMVKFDVFRRVNTGGLPLNFQEIRNIMALPKVRNFLKKMAECKEFLQATREKVKDIRMGAQELCLRYLTILSAYDWKKHDFKHYQGLLKMMDQMVINLNEMSEKDYEELFRKFRLAMVNCQEILGEYSFCKIGNNKINKSLFTSWSIVLVNAGSDKIIPRENAEKLRDAYLDHLKGDAEFNIAITSSTGTRKNILKSIEVIRNLWENCYGKIN